MKNFTNIDTVRGKGRVPYKTTMYPEMAAEDVDFVVMNVDFDLESQLGFF